MSALPGPPHLVFLVGPTSAGKSTVALALAKLAGFDILCADPFQLFFDLPLLTAAPTPAERAAAPHHLYATLPPHETIDAAKYQTLASTKILELTREGRKILVVGGSGLYVKALTHGLDPLPPANETLRADLQARSHESLVQELRERDPATADSIDLKNPHRLLRALEICILTGTPFSQQRAAWKRASPSTLGFFLTRSRENLRDRIDGRIHDIFNKGVVEEVAACPEIGPTLSRVIGYRQIRELLAGRIDLPHCKELVRTATHQYAKRQETWFRKEPFIALPAEPGSEPESLAREIARQLSKPTP